MFPFFKKILMFTPFLLLLLIFAGFIYIFRPPREEPKRIGILFYQTSLTTISFLNGFKIGLAQQGYYQGKNLILFIENMQNYSPQITLATLKKINQKKVDLLVTTGKDLTITIAHTITNKPIIYALVGRPITEETIKTVIDKEKYITGVSYFTPYDRTLELSKRVIPHFRRLALVLPRNSTWPDYNRLKTAADKAGIALTPLEIPVGRLTDTILNLRGRTDAVYLPDDIDLISQTDLIKKTLLDAKLPAISNNLEYQSNCILSYYADPETIGNIAGRMAVKIFNRAVIDYLPVELSGYFKLTINLSLLRRLNIKINEDVLSYANAVI